MKRSLSAMLCLIVAGSLAACKKQEPPSEAPVAVAAKKVSVADGGDAPAPPPPTASEPTETPPPPQAADSKLPPEIHKLMLVVQKRALETGRFPSGWNELIAAGLITAPPNGKDGKPMTWREFELTLDQ